MIKKDNAYFAAGKKRHFYVPNALSLQRAELDQRTIEDIRKEIGLSVDEKMILFLGWDLNRKGLDIAVKAVKMCRETLGMAVKLGVIGAGTNKPKDNTIRYLAAKGCNAYEDYIVYLNGYEDMFALNRAVDGYISSSRAQAFSYGILQAISQNRPVIVSDIDGTKWSWDYSKCFTYPVEDATKCAEAISKALSCEQIESYYMEILSKYDIVKWCNQIIDIYRRVKQTPEC